MFNVGRYVACIAEGSAETAIIDILLEADLLVFNREKLLDETVLRSRSAKAFEDRYLRKRFDGKITVFRILDSRREMFTLRKEYQHKVDVINIITAPEIEMLVILNEDKYIQFKKSGKKPSEFCKSELKLKDVKSYDFVTSYFSDPEVLLKAMKQYREKSRLHKGEYSLLDLLK